MTLAQLVFALVPPLFAPLRTLATILECAIPLRVFVATPLRLTAALAVTKMLALPETLASLAFALLVLQLPALPRTLVILLELVIQPMAYVFLLLGLTALPAMMEILAPTTINVQTVSVAEPNFLALPSASVNLLVLALLPAACTPTSPTERPVTTTTLAQAAMFAPREFAVDL